MHRVKQVKAMNNYLLLLKFDTNEVKIFNCFELFSDPLFSQIKNIEYFKTVHVDDMGFVCWDDATDIDPFQLYENSEPVTNFTFAS